MRKKESWWNEKREFIDNKIKKRIEEGREGIEDLFFRAYLRRLAKIIKNNKLFKTFVYQNKLKTEDAWEIAYNIILKVIEKYRKQKIDVSLYYYCLRCIYFAIIQYEKQINIGKKEDFEEPYIRDLFEQYSNEDDDVNEEEKIPSENYSDFHELSESLQCAVILFLLKKHSEESEQENRKNHKGNRKNKNDFTNNFIWLLFCLLFLSYYEPKLKEELYERIDQKDLAEMFGYTESGICQYIAKGYIAIARLVHKHNLLEGDSFKYGLQQLHRFSNPYNAY